MRITNGAPKLSIAEKNALITFVDHAKQDLAYMQGGTYGDGDEYHSLAEYRRGQKGAEIMDFMLKHLF